MACNQPLQEPQDEPNPYTDQAASDASNGRSRQEPWGQTPLPRRPACLGACRCGHAPDRESRAKSMLFGVSPVLGSADRVPGTEGLRLNDPGPHLGTDKRKVSDENVTA